MKAIQHKSLWILIIFSTVVRCIIASNIELGNDEVYYWTYALHLQSSYFDHPPLVAYFIRLFTFNLHANGEIFVRLTAILGSALNTWLIYRILLRIQNSRAAFYAALLYNACIYTSVISGLFILPDSSEVVFWLLSIYLLIEIFVLQHHQNRLLLLLGVTIGVCTLCKIHGIYLWVAATLFILFYDRKWLLNKYLWISVLITIVLISPIFIWNFQNDFITYTYHSQRVAANNGISISSFNKELAGEFFYENPVFFILCLIIIPISIKHKFYRLDNKLYPLLLLLSLPLIGIFWFISLFRDTLPHWSGPGYIALIIFVAYYADAVFSRRKISRLLYAANILTALILVSGFVFINYLPVQLGSKDSNELGAKDFTLDLYGWKKFGLEFNKIYDADIDGKIMSKDAVVISDKWFPAAHVDYYVAYPNHMKLYAFGPLFDVHNFAWLNYFNKFIKPGDDAYYIAPSNYISDPATLFAHNFKKIEEPIRIPQFRGGRQVREFYVYRMKYYTGGLNCSLPSN